MQVGAVFPQLEIGSDPDSIARYARTVEELGYDHLVIFDHVLGADANRPGGWTGVYDHRSMFHEPFVLYGYVAAITTRIRLATAVIVLPQRQTALVAKQAAEVDVLSRGRLVLGVGIGWNAVEYEALDMSFTNRGRRIEEQIAVLRALWTQEVVDFKGRWHRIDRAGLNPMPVQRPIPLWMGGGYQARDRRVIEPALRRIAAMADGWLTHLPPNEDGRAGMDIFRRYVQEAGRDPAKVPVEGRIPAARGDPEEWKRGVEAFREMGMTSVELTTMGAGYRDLDEHLEALRRFRELI
jgi:probable F420-dependent oxidoreductase